MPKQEKKIPRYLQDIVKNITFDSLPAKWQGFDFARFSKDKALFDFQKQGLQSALKGLWLYFKDKKEDKQNLYNHYQSNDFTENFDYDLKKREGKKTAKYLFDREVDIESLETLKKLNHPKVRGAIVSTFVDVINNLTIMSEEAKLEERKAQASEIKPFPWTRLAVAAQKCVLNFTPVDNELEAKFVRFLDGADDVGAFIKNETRTINLKIPYIAKDGFLRRYIPDFIVKTKNGMVIVETKGREDVDVAAKDLQGKRWAEEVSMRTRTKWTFLRIDQKEFEKARYNKFAELTI